MKILKNLLTSCLVVLICLSFSACSTHHKKPINTFNTATSDEENSSSEPEETAREELEALNKPGMWEYGVNHTYSLKKLGIDPSRYDFPITVNKQVMYYMELFQGKQRDYFTHWLARSSMYRPHIEAELKKARLPQDLVYLAMIESGFNPSAYSSAKACGLWQFMEGTGNQYGLRVDPWVDERREPEKATKAAIRYLSSLYNQFGDWYLAVAAYNAGEGKIGKAMKMHNAKDFWEVAVSDGIFMETKRYVPKLIAAIIIARNPEKYGFKDVNYKSPLEYETIRVPGGVTLDAVAATSNASVKELRTLNNELKKHQTPPKSAYTLRVPVGKRELIASNLDKLRPVTTTVFITHVVKKNETLAGICNQYNISRTTLLKANNLRTAQLPKGLRLRIPSATTKYIIAKEEQLPAERGVKLEGKGKQVQTAIYTLKPGDTLSSVAKKHNVSLQNILEWNKLNQQDFVKGGQQIALRLERSNQEAKEAPVPSTKADVAKIASDIRATAQVPTLEATKKRAVASLQPTPAPKQTPSSIQKISPPTLYVVQNGDTLSTIAKKFQTSARDLRDWNKLSTTTVQIGNKLIVKKG